MAGIGDLIGKLSGGASLGIAGQVLGGIANSIGTAKQIKEAKRQREEGSRFNSAQQSQYRGLYQDLLNQANSQQTYKGDTTAYKNVVGEAEKQKMEAATSVNPADAMMREDARSGTANFIGAATRGARSATDLLSIAGAASGQEASNMRAINTQNAQSAYANRQSAGQNLIGSLSNLAQATARERGLEYESMLQKQQNILGLTKEQGLGGMELAYRGQQEDFARRAALTDAQSSMWSGIGDVFRGVGQGITNYNLMNSQMEMLGNQARSYGQSSPLFNFSQSNISTPNSLKLPNKWGGSGTPVYSPEN